MMKIPTNMSSNATMNLNGTAMVMNERFVMLAVVNCSVLLEVIEGRSLTDGLVAITINPESAVVGNKVSDVEIYALYNDKSLMLLKHDVRVSKSNMTM